MNFGEVYSNELILSIIAFFAGLNLYITWKKRKDDLFKLRFDCYTRLVEIIMLEESSKEVVSKISLKSSSSPRTKSGRYLLNNEDNTLIRERGLEVANLYSEAGFLFGKRTYNFLKSHYTLIGYFSVKERMLLHNLRIKDSYFLNNPNLTQEEIKKYETTLDLILIKKLNIMRPIHTEKDLDHHFNSFLNIGEKFPFKGIIRKILPRFIFSYLASGFLKKRTRKYGPQYELASNLIKIIPNSGQPLSKPLKKLNL